MGPQVAYLSPLLLINLKIGVASAAELAFTMVSEWLLTHWLMDTLALLSRSFLLNSNLICCTVEGNQLFSYVIVWTIKITFIVQMNGSSDISLSLSFLFFDGLLQLIMMMTRKKAITTTIAIGYHLLLIMWRCVFFSDLRSRDHKWSVVVYDHICSTTKAVGYLWLRMFCASWPEVTWPQAKRNGLFPL